MTLKEKPPRYSRKLWIPHTRARYSFSVTELFLSSDSRVRLGKEITHSSPSCTWVKTTPRPVLLASVCRWKGFTPISLARNKIGALVKAPFNDSSVCCCSSPQFHLTLDLNNRVNGSETTANSGMNHRDHEAKPIKRLNCLIFFRAG